MKNTTQTTPAHTAGPWHFEKHPTGSYQIFGDEYSIASLENVIGDESARALEANARLIAAAPELLEALDYLLEQTVDMDLAVGNELFEREEEARQMALSAIAKAHGNAS